MAAAPPRETFYNRVYDLVRRVPEGSVVTYGQVAVLLGAPTASRAVGYALGALPSSSDVPWWRVINARGTISLKGRGPAADVQRDQLEREGVSFDAEGVVNLRVHRWWPADDPTAPA